MSFHHNLVASLLAALALYAPTASASAPSVKVVATFSILGDLVSQVGGDRVEVSVLAGPGADAHVFTPSPAQARTVSQAAVLFSNGLGFEGWMSRLIKSAGYKGQHVSVSKGIETLKASHGHKSGHTHGHHHS